MTQWRVQHRYLPRPHASAEAWVYDVYKEDRYWGTLVDERVRYRTLFEPGKDRHDGLDEFIVPLEGRYWVRSGEWSRTLVPGEIAQIPRATDHDSGTATNLVGTHFLVLLFNPELEILKDAAAGGVALPPGALFWLRGAFRFLRSQPDVTGFLPLTVLPDFLKALHGGQALPPDHAHPDPAVAKVLRILEQVDTPTLQEIGEFVGLSPTHFQKRFKQAMGCSPNQYANAWKLDLIADQIRSGNTLPLVELATEHGFNDMKHFRDLFQRRFGLTPAAYRKNPPSPK